MSLAACNPSPEPVLLSGETMGTAYHVKYIPPARPIDAAAVAASVAEAIVRVDRAMSTYKEDSELSRLNRHAADAPFPLSAPLRQVFVCALEVSRQTGGAFDVTVGPLVNAWGFGPEDSVGEPTPEAIAALRERLGFERLSLVPEGIVKNRDDVYCDLSAVAKGYAVDCAAAALEVAGVARYMVEIGGEVRTRGLNADGVPWRIAIERPDTGDARMAQRIVGLDGVALATSGDYRNFFLDETGRRLSHTIDPRTGAPVTHALASVSVFHPECAWADAYATALMVLGPDEGMRFAEEHDLAVLLLIRRDDGTFDELASAAFARGFGE